MGLNAWVSSKSWGKKLSFTAKKKKHPQEWRWNPCKWSFEMAWFFRISCFFGSHVFPWDFSGFFVGSVFRSSRAWDLSYRPRFRPHGRPYVCRSSLKLRHGESFNNTVVVTGTKVRKIVSAKQKKHKKIFGLMQNARSLQHEEWWFLRKHECHPGESPAVFRESAWVNKKAASVSPNTTTSWGCFSISHLSIYPKIIGFLIGGLHFIGQFRFSWFWPCFIATFTSSE